MYVFPLREKPLDAKARLVSGLHDRHGRQDGQRRTRMDATSDAGTLTRTIAGPMPANRLSAFSFPRLRQPSARLAGLCGAVRAALLHWEKSFAGEIVVATNACRCRRCGDVGHDERARGRRRRLLFLAARIP